MKILERAWLRPWVYENEILPELVQPYVNMPREQVQALAVDRMLSGMITPHRSWFFCLLFPNFYNAMLARWYPKNNASISRNSRLRVLIVNVQQ